MTTPTHGNAPQSPQGAARPWMTIHRCPTCGSDNVRRSTVRERERDVGEHKFHSPYRCRACNERFWVVSRKARTAATLAVACGVGLALLVALIVVSISDDEAESPAPALTDAATSGTDEPAKPAPALQDPLRSTDPPRPTTRPPAPAPDTQSETRPLRPPAQPFVK
ncbi:MAG TPA: hypothetical protein VJX31_12180 [Casimicrobiaceae bacterium]|nr:hypothetical protein [Casimicrobiaceae bacterium]